MTFYFNKMLHMTSEERNLLTNGGVSVGRSSDAKDRIPIDLTIEQTINRHAKTQGGIIGFSRNRPAY